MNVKDFLAGVRARATVNDNDNDRITAHWVDESGRVVASHTAAAGDPIDYRSGLCGGDDVLAGIVAGCDAVEAEDDLN